MKVNRKARLTGALVTLAGTGALVAFGSAGAFTGQAGSGGPPTSSAPDLLTAKVVRKVGGTDTLGPQVDYCFDAILKDGSIVANQFRISNYDTANRYVAANATIDTDPATVGKCVRATFANGQDIAQASVAYIRDNQPLTSGGAAVTDLAGADAPSESAPVDGNGIVPALKAVAGATTRPDLLSVSVDSGANPPQITYTFDEDLDPALPKGISNASTELADHFGFYVQSDRGQCDGTGPGDSTQCQIAAAGPPQKAQFGRRGDSVAGISGASITINYLTADQINQGAWFFVDPGLGSQVNTPRDVVGPLAPATDCLAGQCVNTTISPIGAVGPAANSNAPSGAPTLISATKDTNNSSVIMKFSQQVASGLVENANAPGAAVQGRGNIVAYRADGTPIQGSYTIGTNGSDVSTLRAVMPNTTQEDPISVVRIASRPGLANNTDTPASNNNFAAVPIGTEPVANGLTDGVDLLTTVTHDNDNTVDYTFDEPFHSTPKPSGIEFNIINSDGTVRIGQAGSAVLSNSNKTVTVKFNGSVAAGAVAGVANDVGNQFDAVDDVNQPAGNPNAPGSVSATILGCQPGQSCVTPTPTVTTTALPITPTPGTPTPTATTPPVTVTATAPPVTVTPTATPTQTITSKVSGLSRSGKKITGKVKASAPCKSGRKVVATKGSKTLASAKSKGSGKFTLSSKKIKKAKGKVTVTIKKRTLTSGGVKVTCKAKSGKV